VIHSYLSFLLFLRCVVSTELLSSRWFILLFNTLSVRLLFLFFPWPSRRPWFHMYAFPASVLWGRSN
jgi:hypothetical protein